MPRLRLYCRFPVNWRRSTALLISREKAIAPPDALSGFASCFRVTGDGRRQIVSLHVRGDLLDVQSGGMAAYTISRSFAPKAWLVRI